MKLLYSLLSLSATTLAADLCNPLKQSCDPDKALGTSIKETFSSKSKYFTEKVSNGLSYSGDGVRFRVAKKGDNPSIMSNFYMMFGKVEAVMKAAPGRGIVTSFFLQSDDHDEIDIELLGADTKQWQSNFFLKGNTATYDRGEFHDAPTSLVDEYHTYTIEFTQDTVTFALDGTIMRTLDPNNPQGFPQTPMRIYAGAWAGGDPSNPPGTIEWAGGLTDFSQAPFDMDIKSIIAVDYSSGSEYKYTDQSGSWSSIEAVGGKVNGRKTQAQSDFEELKNGKEVSASSFEASSSILSSTLGESISSKSQSSSTPANETDSESSSSKAVSMTSNVSKTSKAADTSSSATSDDRPSTMITSASSKPPAVTVSQVSSGGAPFSNIGFYISLLTFIGYFV